MSGASLNKVEIRRTPETKSSFGSFRSVGGVIGASVTAGAPTITRTSAEPDYLLEIAGATGNDRVDIFSQQSAGGPLLDSRLHAFVAPWAAIEVVSIAGFSVDMSISVGIQSPVLIDPGSIGAFFGFSIAEEFSVPGHYFFTGPFFTIPHTDNNKGYILWSIAGPTAEVLLNTGDVIRIKDMGWQVVARNRSLNDSA